MCFVRAGREIETVDAFPKSSKDIASGLGDWPLLQGYAYHWGVEVKFEPDLDGAFGITNDKQTVRPLEDFWKILAKEGIDDLLNKENNWQSKSRRKKNTEEAKEEDSKRDKNPTSGEKQLLPQMLLLVDDRLFPKANKMKSIKLRNSKPRNARKSPTKNMKIFSRH
jgi:hypothetical protein